MKVLSNVSIFVGIFYISFTVFRIRRSPYTVSCKTTSWGNYRHPQQFGVLNVLYDQRRHVVLPLQVIQHSWARPIQRDQKIFWVILFLTIKSTANQQRDKGWRKRRSHAVSWRLSKPPLSTTSTHSRSSTTNRRRIGIDDTKWIYGLLWTISIRLL